MALDTKLYVSNVRNIFITWPFAVCTVCVCVCAVYVCMLKDKLIKADIDTHAHTHTSHTRTYKYLYVIRFLWSNWEWSGWENVSFIFAGTRIRHAGCVRCSDTYTHGICGRCIFTGIKYAALNTSSTMLWIKREIRKCQWIFFTWYHFQMECQCRYRLPTSRLTYSSTSNCTNEMICAVSIRSRAHTHARQMDSFRRVQRNGMLCDADSAESFIFGKKYSLGSQLTRTMHGKC